VRWCGCGSAPPAPPTPTRPGCCSSPPRRARRRDRGRPAPSSAAARPGRRAPGRQPEPPGAVQGASRSRRAGRASARSARRCRRRSPAAGHTAAGPCCWASQAHRDLVQLNTELLGVLHGPPAALTLPGLPVALLVPAGGQGACSSSLVRSAGLGSRRSPPRTAPPAPPRPADGPARSHGWGGRVRTCDRSGVKLPIRGAWRPYLRPRFARPPHRTRWTRSAPFVRTMIDSTSAPEVRAAPGVAARPLAAAGPGSTSSWLCVLARGSAWRGSTVGRTGVAGRAGRWGARLAVVPRTPPGGVASPGDDRAAVEPVPRFSPPPEGVVSMSCQPCRGGGLTLAGSVSITAASSCLHRRSGVRSKAAPAVVGASSSSACAGRRRCGIPPGDRAAVETPPSTRPRVS